MRLAVIAKSAWKDLPARVDALAKSLSSKLPEKVSISLILKDYGDIPADRNGRIKSSFLDKTLALDGYDGACLLVSLSDRKKYGLKDTLRGHYHRDEDGYVEFWVASDRLTKRKKKPQFEETFSHELCHGLYHWLGIPKTTDETKHLPNRDNTHYFHDVLGSLDGAFAEISAAWPKKKAAVSTAKDKLKGVDPKLAEFAKRLMKGMASIGHPMFVSEGFRSEERQAELYAQGRTKPGKIVTNAKPGQSLHNTGRAVDIVFDSKNPWADSHPWETAGQVGESIAIAMGINVSWGGRWAGLRDLPHWQIQ